MNPAMVNYLGAVNAAMQPAPAQPAAPAGIDPSWMQPPPGRTVDLDAPVAHSQVIDLDAPPPPGAQGGSLFDRFGSMPMPAPPGAAPHPPDAPAPAPAPNVSGPAQAAPQEAPQGIPERPFPLQAIGGSRVIPAHEVDLRGPTLKAAQANAIGATEGAVQANTANTQSVARDEYAMYLDQARQAHAREAAMQQAQAERDEELQQRAQDFDQSVKALGKMAFQPDGGWWASRSTPQKISAIVSIGLGGFLQGARGGSNPGLDIINGQIDREVRAQEFAYHAALGQANAKQTAFAMAMQKYNNADAARAMTRAAALDGVQAQIAAQGALWKDADAANRANAAMAELEQQKMQQIAQGVRFIMPQAVGRKFVDPRTGLVYSEQEAKAMATEMRGQEFKREEIGLNTAGKVIEEGAKAQAQRETKQTDDAKFIAEKLQAAGVPQARHSMETALQLLNESRGGVGEAVVRGALPDVAAQKVLSDKANAREQAFMLARADLIHALTGAGMSDTERKNYYDMMGAASTPEARIRTLQMGLQKLEAIEKNAKAGVSPQAQETFDARRQAAEGGPAVAPKGASKGWR